MDPPGWLDGHENPGIGWDEGQQEPLKMTLEEMDLSRQLAEYTMWSGHR